MGIATLACPRCGAPASTDAPACGYCGVQLLTASCPRCFGSMWATGKFCPHCGAAAERAEAEAPRTLACPRCHAAMVKVVVGATPLHECTGCDGLWLDRETFDGLVADRERQATLLGPGGPAVAPALEREVRYIKCPVCQAVMNRRLFARGAKVIIDVCKQHGVWFDRDELRACVEFVLRGGLDEARSRDREDLVEERRRLESARLHGDGYDGRAGRAGSEPPVFRSDDADGSGWGELFRTLGKMIVGE